MESEWEWCSSYLKTDKIQWISASLTFALVSNTAKQQLYLSLALANSIHRACVYVYWCAWKHEHFDTSKCHCCVVKNKVHKSNKQKLISLISLTICNAVCGFRAIFNPLYDKLVCTKSYRVFFMSANIFLILITKTIADHKSEWTENSVIQTLWGGRMKYIYTFRQLKNKITKSK